MDIDLYVFRHPDFKSKFGFYVGGRAAPQKINLSLINCLWKINFSKKNFFQATIIKKTENFISE